MCVCVCVCVCVCARACVCVCLLSDILSTTTTTASKDQAISFLSLKNRIVELLRVALMNETDPTNTQMLLGRGSWSCAFC